MTLSEEQVLNLRSERVISQSQELIKKKIEIGMQQWEKRRRDEEEDLSNP